MITPASDQDCRLVKAAVVGKLARTYSIKEAEQLYNWYMDKLAQAMTPVPAAPADGAAPAPGAGPKNVSAAMPQAPGNVAGLKTTATAAGKVNGAASSPMGAGNMKSMLNAGDQTTKTKGGTEMNEQQMAQAQQGSQPSPNPRSPFYQPPTAMSIANNALMDFTNKESPVKAATDRQLLICKAACVMQAAKYKLHPDVAIVLFNNQLNKCAHELLSVIK